jgi:universal stress protein E
MTEEISQGMQRVFVVLDPDRMVQPAFERGEWIASRNGAILHLFCCIGEKGVAADDPAAIFARQRVEHWLKRLTEEAADYQITTEIQIEWNPNWRDRIAEAATECGADMIVKTVSRHSGLARQLKATADWTILSKATCPVLLIDPARPPQPKKVLAAVKLNPDSEQYSVLNEQVLGLAHQISEALEAELNAVTVYKGDEIHFDRQRLADKCGLPRNAVHAAEGAPHKQIAEVARKIGADVLVIGSASRNLGDSGSFIGDTAQRIIDAVDTDLVVVPAA